MAAGLKQHLRCAPRIRHKRRTQVKTTKKQISKINNILNVNRLVETKDTVILRNYFPAAARCLPDCALQVRQKDSHGVPGHNHSRVKSNMESEIEKVKLVNSVVIADLHFFRSSIDKAYWSLRPIQ